MARNQHETAAGDMSAAGPAGLSPSQWARWRASNPPPWLRPEHRRGEHCGLCGEPLTLVTRICWRCYQDDAAACRNAAR